MTSTKDIVLTTKLDRKLGLLKADPVQIEQVIINLAVNAHDTMPDGGKLMIETKSIFPDETGSNENGEMAAGGHVLLAISDTGSGMDGDRSEEWG